MQFPLSWEEKGWGMSYLKRKEKDNLQTEKLKYLGIEGLRYCNEDVDKKREDVKCYELTKFEANELK
jgi:hypothetical protein